jgi:LPS-assembly protein
MIRIRQICLIIALLGSLLTQQVFAAAPERPLLSANQIRYDQNNEVAIANGNVELVQGQRIIRADYMTYNQKTDVVTAQGNVTVVEPDGNVIFANRAELTGDMKRGFVDQVGMLMPDNSRFAAQEGEKLAGRYTIMRNTTYSPCDLCKEDRMKPPIWQMRASKVTHDDKEKMIIYRDAFMEVGGIPVLYTPYFSHPDPSVKRKSGFLSPTAGRTQNLQQFVTVPYYYVFDQDLDATIAPTYSGKDGLQLAGQYRQRFERGRAQFDGSVVRADRITDQNKFESDQLRGHLFGDIVYNINNKWRTGADIAFTSDKSYLYRYRIPTKDVLTNRGYVERFSGRDYAGLDVYYFQDLRPGDRPTEPVVAPNINLNMIGEPGKTLGGRWELNGSVVALSRDKDVTPVTRRGPDSRRASVEAGWERNLTSDLGLVTTVSGNVRMDAFWATRLTDPNNTASVFRNVYSLRTLPQGEITFRYPFGRQSGSWQQIIEPIVSFTAAPRLRDYPRIANEDSIDVEFDDTSLFNKNRFTGYDRLEGGSRVTYGLRGGAYSDNGKRIDVMFGQSYRFNRDTLFPKESGLQDKRSDYVGRVELQPASWLQASYGFRLDAKSFSPRRSEIRGSLGQPWLRTYGNFISTDKQDTTSGKITVSEITYGATSQLYKYYSISASQKRSLKPQSEPRNTWVSLAYTDECITASLNFSQDETSRTDVSSGSSFFFNVLFKNLGGFKTDAVSAN